MTFCSVWHRDYLLKGLHYKFSCTQPQGLEGIIMLHCCHETPRIIYGTSNNFDTFFINYEIKTKTYLENISKIFWIAIFCLILSYNSWNKNSPFFFFFLSSDLFFLFYRNFDFDVKKKKFLHLQIYFTYIENIFVNTFI